ncbi:MAG: hypothetical protein NVS9B1_24890 [Candidatus Dormibacteraceae bacterium]
MSALRQAAAAALVALLLFVGFSVAVAGYIFTAPDHVVADDFARIWVPSLLPLFRTIALFGGIEAAGMITIGLFVYLFRAGYRLAAYAAAAIPLSTVAETLYKHFLDHPGPPKSISHPDGPSLSDLLDQGSAFGSSFPSGHITRFVVAYGMLAFVIHRLARRAWLRRAAIPIFVVLTAIECFDRLYLEVHWESDVIGGLLLGGTFLAAAVTWLEWSEAKRHE